MTPNNYSEIKELSSIQDKIMDAIARVDDVLRRHAGQDEMQLLCRSINDKQEAVLVRLFEYRRAIDLCFEKLRVLEEKEDQLHLECMAMLGRDLEDADAAKAHLITANSRLSGWTHRNLERLKVVFSREKVGV